MKKLYLSTVLLYSSFTLYAQLGTGSGYLKAADNYYHKGDYASASDYYQKFLSGGKTGKQGYDPYANNHLQKQEVKGSSEQQAVYNLAESFRQLHDYIKATPYYRAAASFDQSAYPLALYWYGVALRSQKKYAASDSAFQQFLTGYTTNDSYRESATRERNNLGYIQQQLQKKGLGLYQVQKAQAPLNATGASYAPVWRGNQLLFTSTRPDSAAGKGSIHMNKLYEAVYQNGAVNDIHQLDLPGMNQVHEGVAAITPDGNTLYFTRWAITGTVRTSALYSAKKQAGKWALPVLLDSAVNGAGENARQPFVMPDGKWLLFASDRKGGSGGFDLWYAPLDASGKPGKAVNMGKSINSAGDEQAPYYHTGSGTLVFSSNGRTGMGGFDFFYSKGNTLAGWREPENFGYPVNSEKDDLYFAANSTSKNILAAVLLSSDRASACCLELFAVSKKQPVTRVSGQIVSCDSQTPLPGATVKVIDTITQVAVYTGTADNNGRYAFTLDEQQSLAVVASLKGYITDSRSLKQPETKDSDTAVHITSAVCLVKEVVEIVPTEEPVVLQHIYFELNKANLTPASYPALNKLVTFIQADAATRIEISGHTDDRGSAALNQQLSLKRAQSVVDFLISKGVDKQRLVAKGYGADKPIAPNRNKDGSDNPEGREQNRRTEMKVLK
jgi:outer membrane protein OmpA-like peptidoglycan-associated protein/tetratricopeptide (TPR) repeat protein